mmetsp:Transcript_47305/g.93071  ORF Transcript_47305/g.93071 Transcript_47305/m.93071 type:complete len:362 (-) Transcript_47305:1353-2438(-)
MLGETQVDNKNLSYFYVTYSDKGELVFSKTLSVLVGTLNAKFDGVLARVRGPFSCLVDNSEVQQRGVQPDSDSLAFPYVDPVESEQSLERDPIFACAWRNNKPENSVVRVVIPRVCDIDGVADEGLLHGFERGEAAVCSRGCSEHVADRGQGSVCTVESCRAVLESGVAQSETERNNSFTGVEAMGAPRVCAFGTFVKRLAAVRARVITWSWPHIEIEDGNLVSVACGEDGLDSPASWDSFAKYDMANAEGVDAGLTHVQNCSYLGIVEQGRDVQRDSCELNDDHRLACGVGDLLNQSELACGQGNRSRILTFPRCGKISPDSQDNNICHLSCRHSFRNLAGIVRQHGRNARLCGSVRHVS